MLNTLTGDLNWPLPKEIKIIGRADTSQISHFEVSLVVVLLREKNTTKEISAFSETLNWTSSTGWL